MTEREEEKARFNEYNIPHFDSLKMLAQKVGGDVKFTNKGLQFEGIPLLEDLSIEFTYEVYRLANAALQGIGWYQELNEKISQEIKSEKPEEEDAEI